MDKQLNSKYLKLPKQTDYKPHGLKEGKMVTPLRYVSGSGNPRKRPTGKPE